MNEGDFTSPQNDLTNIPSLNDEPTMKKSRQKLDQNSSIPHE